MEETSGGETMLQGWLFEEKMEVGQEKEGVEGRRQVERRDVAGERQTGKAHIEHLSVILLLSIDLLRVSTRPCVSVCEWEAHNVLEVWHYSPPLSYLRYPAAKRAQPPVTFPTHARVPSAPIYAW